MGPPPLVERWSGPRSIIRGRRRYISSRATSIALDIAANEAPEILNDRGPPSSLL
jgi:hypothetical protein